MATELKAAMDKGELRSLLAKSKHAPVNCAVAFGDGKKSQPALILLHRSKAPNALMKEIHKDFPEAKNARFGTASVDPDTDPKLVLLQLNQAASGLASKLVKSLKGTGFSKVKVVLEDGTVAEQEAEPEEGEAPQATATRGKTAEGGEPLQRPAPPSAPAETPAPPQQAASSTDQPAPPSQAAAAPAAAPSGAAVMRRLTELVKRLIQADPAKLARLKALAVQAQAALKSGDVPAAEQLADQLDAALGAKPAAPAAPAAPAPASAAPDPAQIAAVKATNAKARAAWVATRQKVDSDLAKLHGAFTGAFKGHPKEGDLTKAFRGRVDTVLNTLGEELAHTLDAVNGATNPAERQKLVEQAHAHIAQYTKHLAADPTISALDNNPFVPLAIQKTMTATLGVLSKTIR